MILCIFFSFMNFNMNFRGDSLDFGDSVADYSLINVVKWVQQPGDDSIIFFPKLDQMVCCSFFNMFTNYEPRTHKLKIKTI